MVTLEDCLAAFFAADELKGKQFDTVVFYCKSGVDENISVRICIYFHCFLFSQGTTCTAVRDVKSEYV